MASFLAAIISCCHAHLLGHFLCWLPLSSLELMELSDKDKLTDDLSLDELGSSAVLL
jgi:hypothetical protein